MSANNEDADNAERLIVYSPLYLCNPRLFTRKYSEFHQEIPCPKSGGSLKRFKKVTNGWALGMILRLTTAIRCLAYDVSEFSSHLQKT